MQRYVMNRYEILLLAVPHMTEDESTAIERGIEKIVQGVPGSVITSYDKWGKCKLAYPIGEHEYGLYFLIRFTLTDPKSVFDAIHTFLTMKYSESVIRHLMKKLDKNEPAVYVRQEIVEEAKIIAIQYKQEIAKAGLTPEHIRKFLIGSFA